MTPSRVTRCLLCADVDIDVEAQDRFIITRCAACSAVLRIEFNPPDDPSLRARIERLDDAESPRNARDVRTGYPRRAD